MALTKGGLLIDPDSLSYTLKYNSNGISWTAGTVTVTAATPVLTIANGYITGAMIHVGGCDVESFDGSFAITRVTDSSFTYQLPSDPGAVATVAGYSYPATNELLVDQVRKTVKLIRVGNLTSDGVSLKCLYSKLKELWKTDATLIKYPFPMIPITDEQFEFVNGWNIENKFSSITEIGVRASGLTSSNATDPVTAATTSTITTPADFITAGVEVGMYVGYEIPGLPTNNGGTSGQEGAKVVSVTANSCVLDKHLLANFGTISTTASATTTGTNRVTVASSTGVREGMRIIFTGTGFGNIVSGTSYFVKSIIDTTGITISTTLGGTTFALTTDSGSLSVAVYTDIVKFWSKNDHSYNLIRSGGWAWKSADGVYTNEEWMNASTLGSLGLQGSTITLTGVTASTTVVQTATNTTVTTNVVTVSSTTGMVVGAPIVFSGSVFGGIVSGTTYYINNVVNATTFKISSTYGGGEFTLSTAAGSMTATASSVTITWTGSNGNPIVGSYITAPGLMEGSKIATVDIPNKTLTLISSRPVKTNIGIYNAVVTPTDSVASTDAFTVASTTNLVKNTPIIFTGTVFGGVTSGFTYYIKEVIDATHFSVSTTYGGPIFALTDSSGSMTATQQGTGGVATVRPKDQVYYQLGSSTTTGKVFALTGAVNQALRYKQLQQSFTGTGVGITQLSVTDTTVTTNVFTVASTTGLVVGSPIVFSGTVFGGVVSGTTYYVVGTIAGTTFQVSSTYGGAAFTLSTASGTMTAKQQNVAKISSATWSGQVLTVNTTEVHGLLTGHYAELRNTGSSHYDGVVKVIRITDNQFTFSQPFNDGSLGAVGVVSKGPTITSVSSVAGLYAGLGVANDTGQTGIPSGAAIIEVIDATTIALTSSTTNSTIGIKTGTNVGASTSVQKFYVREQGYTYAVATKEQIGVSTPTYKLYSYPLQNTLDLNVTHSDTIVAGAAVTVATWSGGKATLTTGTTLHGLAIGDSITVTGITPSGYNGVFVITDVDSTTTLRYTVADPGGAGTVFGWTNKSVYANCNITFLRDPNNSNVQYSIKGDFTQPTAYVKSDVVKDTGNSRWYKCILAYTSSATLPSADGTHWALYEGERLVGGVYAAYNVIIDADATKAGFVAASGELTVVSGADVKITHASHGITNGDKITIEGATPTAYNGFWTVTSVAGNDVFFTVASAPGGSSSTTANVRDVTKYLEYGISSRFEVYEKHQYLLRQNGDIDTNTNGSQNGQIAASMLVFVGPTLVTTNGVYIDNFSANDTNDIEFYDGTGTLRKYLYVSTLTLTYGDNLKADADSKYWVFFTNANGSLYGTSDAIIVQTNEVTDMSGNVTGANSTTLTFNYDGNVQGGRTAGTDADITVVAIGLNTGQYVKSTGTIAKSKSNSVSLVAALERNYSNIA